MSDNGNRGVPTLGLLLLAFLAVLVQQRGPLMRYLKIERM
jgi:hypothetical protein